MLRIKVNREQWNIKMFHNINKPDNMNEYHDSKDWRNDEESDIEPGKCIAFLNYSSVSQPTHISLLQILP